MDIIIAEVQSRDRNLLYSIYSKSDVYKHWPIYKQDFERILFGHQDIDNQRTVLVAKHDNEIVGFISVKYKVVKAEKKAVVVFIFVTENHRKKGVGSHLVHEGINWLKKKGAKEVTVGGGAGSWFWPGIPENLHCNTFFEKNGFKIIDDTRVDMILDLSSYTPHAAVYKGVKENGIEIRYAESADRDKIVSFIDNNFDNWTEHYVKAFDGGKERIFCASKNGKIIASSLLWKSTCHWKILFDNNVGGGGDLGVDPKWRGKGIGLAMKSWGMEVLKNEGIKYCWVAWTHVPGFYEKLGFKLWRKYLKASLNLDSGNLAIQRSHYSTKLI